MAGALAERDFVEKFQRANFADVQVLEREPVSLDQLALYPLFTDEILDLMHRLIPAPRQHSVATAIVVHARRASGPSPVD